VERRPRRVNAYSRWLAPPALVAPLASADKASSSASVVISLLVAAVKPRSRIPLPAASWADEKPLMALGLGKLTLWPPSLAAGLGIAAAAL